MDINTQAIKENKEEINKWKENKKHLLKALMFGTSLIQKKMEPILNGLPEKDNENTSKVVIGDLTRGIPLSVDKLHETRHSSSYGKD